MPYIGNSHIVGDHINNFKVLDDISSYTATFDGSSTDVVSTANETLRIAEHRFVQGQRVTYNNGGGSNIGGLASGTAYYVSFDTTNTIKLATSLVNANNGTLINLTSAGGGTTHTLTAAFDGINTKFKLTHNSGESGRLNNATQLQVAINNVLQRPNSDPDNFTEGFAVEGGNKIVFQTAPTSNDIFWGSIIANSLPTFDIDAAAVDNFTGDGSATDFTLSRIPPNNASIIVTINGVFQHLSDPTTARAYSLEASVIKFTSAPASGDEIQVRHTGFRGALGDIVTGFYGRTGNVTLIASDDILTRNINSSGIITASSFSGDGSGLIGVASTDNIVTGTAATFNTYPVDINAGMTVAGVATFSGNVSIAGTLTYEDVKNVDSVGLGTFREGIFLPDTKKAQFGNAAGNVDLEIYSTGAESVIKNNTYAFFIQGGTQNNSIYIRPTANENSILATSNGSVSLYYDNSKKLETYNQGVSVSGNLVATGTIYANTNIEINNIAPQIFLVDSNNNSDFAIQNNNGSFIVRDTTNSANRFTINSSGNSTFANDLDVDGHTNLDNVSIAGVSTFAGTITAATVNATGGAFTGNLRFSNNVGTLFGASDELQVFHNSGTSYISHNGSGQLQLRAKSNEHGIKIFPDGAVELYHDNTKRLETTATGIKVTGTTATGSVFLGDFRVKNTNDTNFVTFKPAESLVRWHDNHKAVFGGSNDFQLFHNGTDNFIRTENGSIRVTNYGENMAKFIPNGAVELYHDNIKRLETSSVGVSIPQDLDVDGHTNLDNVNIAGVVTATSYYGDGSNLSNVISGVDVKFEGASVGTGVTMLNFVGFNTVTPPASGLSTITSGQNLTIGVRSGSAVEASLTGTSFNVIARSGGNISINI